MLTEHLDATSAAFQVGYESPSQFSQEYSPLVRRAAVARYGELADECVKIPRQSAPIHLQGAAVRVSRGSADCDIVSPAKRMSSIADLDRAAENLA
jgi:hypothetical protein